MSPANLLRNNSMKIQHISADPRMQAAQAKLQDLRQQLAEATETAHKLRNANYADYRQTLEDEAQAILDGKPVRETSVNVESEALARKCSILRRAIEIQEQEVARVKSEVSTEICEAAAPEYVVLAHAVVDAVKVLRDALDSEFQIRNELDLADVSFTSAIRPCVFPLGQVHGDFMLGIENFLRQAAANGYE